MLGACRRPQRKQPMVRIGECSATADSDEARVAVFGKDHRYASVWSPLLALRSQPTPEFTRLRVGKDSSTIHQHCQQRAVVNRSGSRSGTTICSRGLGFNRICTAPQALPKTFNSANFDSRIRFHTSVFLQTIFQNLVPGFPIPASSFFAASINPNPPNSALIDSLS